MKNLAAITVILSFLLASCSSTYNSSAPYDDVYASGKTATTVVEKRVTTVTSEPVESTTAYEGDYYSPDTGVGEGEYSEEFNPDEYYDYEYSSRIKRFHDPNTGFDYYNNYYTDQYYYNYDPYCYGSSIYAGYGCGYPSYWGPSLSFSFGWGYPSSWHNPYWYDPWYSYGYYPYYYGGWGYGSYWNGYWNGYYDGYWNGYYGGGYYPSYDDDYGSSYYGPRGRRGGSTNGSNRDGDAPSRPPRDGYNNYSGETTTTGTTKDIRNLNGVTTSQTGVNKEAAVNDPSVTSARGFRTADDATSKNIQPAGTTTNDPGIKTIIPTRDKEAPRTEPANGGDVRKIAGNETTTRTLAPSTKTGETRVYEKPASERTARETGNPGNNTQNNTYMSPSRRVEPEMKYEKPKTYTSPTYRTKPSSQEYSSPSTRDTRTNTGQDGETRKVYQTTPERRSVDNSQERSNQSRSYTAPSSTQSRSYTSPSNSTRSTYSAPSNSGSKSYSAPSRSYSSPSGGSRSSSPSSGSGGGSRGRR